MNENPKKKQDILLVDFDLGARVVWSLNGISCTSTVKSSEYGLNTLLLSKYICGQIIDLI